MRCAACGEENAPNSRYCHACGGRLALTCAACGQENEAGSRFCGNCGAELESAHRARSGAVRRARPFSRGELKHASVLYADLVSSTSLVAGLDAEAAMQRLEPAIRAMCDAVERFGGTVLRTLGDGIVALFGAPRAQEAHALRSCHAALAILDAFPTRSGSLSVRVGLHSGEVVADAPPADPETALDAYGLTLHLGSRLTANVEPGEICVTEESYRQVRAFADVVPLGPRALRGVPEPTQLFRLVGLRQGSIQQFSGATLSSFRGRDEAMRVMQRALSSLDSGSGGIIGVAGPPGAGKSRLCYEFAVSCREFSIPVFEARANYLGTARPLQPVIELLRSAFFQISPRESPQAAVRSVAERLADNGASMDVDLPIMCDFLGLPLERAAPSWIDPKSRNERLLATLRGMVRRLGETKTVIIIEDLHWLDQASEKFVDALAQAVATTRILLILNFRASYAARWMGFAHYREIELEALLPSDTDLLVRELIGSAEELADIRSRIAERSGGNPFFAEELIRSMVERAALVGSRGDYRSGAPLNEAALPETIQGVIGARIDLLSEAERDVLQIAAIIGKEFEFEILQKIAGDAEAELQATLARLCAAGMLHPQSSSDGHGYAFYHPLIQEVAYSIQLRSRRAPLHAAAARAIESLYEDRIDEFAALLSYHFEQAADLRNAAIYASRAARRAGMTSASHAVRHWRKVQSLVAALPRSHEMDILKIAASGQVAWLGWREGLTSKDAQPLIQEALQLAREIDDSIVPLLLFVEGRIDAASGGEADAYVERVRHALSLTDRTREPGRVATLNASLSQAYGWAGLLREALQASDAALEGIAEVTDFDHQFLGYSVEHWTLSLRGRILLRLGKFDDARACIEGILAVNVLIDPTVIFIGFLAYVELAWCLRDVEMATEFASRVAAIAERAGSAYMKAYSLACDGVAFGLRGDYAAGIAALNDGVRLVREHNVAMEYEPDMLANLAELTAQTGAAEQAIEAANEAIRIARRRTARLAECRAQISLGKALLAARGEQAREEAGSLFDSAGALIDVSGARIYEGLLEDARKLLAR